jgi:Na+/proline symporter
MVTGIAVFSSTLSGFGFVGGPGLVYKMGISSVWMVICASIGFCLSFHLLAKRLRLFAEIKESVSLPDLVATRYGSETSRFLIAIAIILGVMAYLGTQIKAMAVVLQEILHRGSFLSDISLEWCVVISSAVLVFYCVTGGIIASVYTDLFQGIVMVIAAVLVFVTAYHVLPGGLSEISTTIARDDPEAMSPWGTLGILGCISWYFLFAFGGAGQPHVITKMMMNRKVRDARFILPVSIIGFGISALLWVSIGLAMRALALQKSIERRCYLATWMASVLKCWMFVGKSSPTKAAKRTMPSVTNSGTLNSTTSVPSPLMVCTCRSTRLDSFPWIKVT